MAEATSLAQPYTVPPTKIDVVIAGAVPITKPIPSGKKLDFLTCSSPGCAVIAGAFTDAATMVGWKVKVLTVGTAANAITDAYNTAIRDAPDGVAVAAVSSDPVHPQLATLQSMNIPVVTVQDPDVAFGPIIASLYTHASSEALGKVTADYLLSKNCGSGKILYAQLNGYLVLVKRLDAYNAEMARLAPSVKTQVVNVTGEPTSTTAAIVGAIRSDPSIDCVYLSYDGAVTGLPQAIKSAGAPLPKIVTDYAGDATLQYIKDDLVTATDIGDSGSYGFIYIDTFIRHFLGMSLDADVAALQPIWFVDKSNVPATMPYSPVADLKDQYKTLWGLS
jgi:ABC-type sugar transport system substrate-binding protein